MVNATYMNLPGSIATLNELVRARRSGQVAVFTAEMLPVVTAMFEAGVMKNRTWANGESDYWVCSSLMQRAMEAYDDANA